GEGLRDLEPFLLGEALDQDLLRLKAEAALALFLRRDPDVGDGLLHGVFLNWSTDVDMLRITGQGRLCYAVLSGRMRVLFVIGLICFRARGRLRVVHVGNGGDLAL